MKSIFFVFLFILSCRTISWGYVGPGVGITMLGGFWAFVSVIGVLIAGLLVWPIRTFLRRKKANRDDEEES